MEYTSSIILSDKRCRLVKSFKMWLNCLKKNLLYFQTWQFKKIGQVELILLNWTDEYNWLNHGGYSK